MPHIPFSRLMSTAPRASLSSDVKPSAPYLGSGRGETNPVSRQKKSKLEFISRVDPLKHEVDPLRVINFMSQNPGAPKREYKTDEHTRGLVSDDTSDT